MYRLFECFDHICNQSVALGSQHTIFPVQQIFVNLHVAHCHNCNSYFQINIKYQILVYVCKPKKIAEETFNWWWPCIRRSVSLQSCHRGLVINFNIFIFQVRNNIFFHVTVRDPKMISCHIDELHFSGFIQFPQTNPVFDIKLGLWSKLNITIIVNNSRQKSLCKQTLGAHVV